MKHLVIGHDRGFGKGRSSDGNRLHDSAGRIGFGIEVVPPFDMDGAPVSSTRIRGLVAEGRTQEAADALGRPYQIRGRVERGDGRGRDLGMPTANLALDDPHKLLPLEGSYAITVSGLGGGVGGGERPGRARGMPPATLALDAPHKLLPLEGIYAITVSGLGGVMHLGPRPTFAGARPSIEVHLFDFDRDIYHQTITVEV